MRKIVIGGLIGIIAWQVLYNDALSNALLALLLGGELPFSDVVLAPQLIIIVVAALLFLVVFWLMVKFAPKPSPHAKRALNRQSMEPPQTPRAVATNTVGANEPQATAVHQGRSDAIYSPTLYRRGNQWRIRRRIWLAHKLAVWNEWLDRHSAMGMHRTKIASRHTARYLQGASVKSREKLREVSTIALQTAETGITHGKHASVQAARVVAKTSKDTWAFVSPYLWRFDHWLEQQTRSIRQRLAESFRSYDSLVILLDVVEEVLVSVGLRRPGRR
jgi:hypothetical protein